MKNIAIGPDVPYPSWQWVGVDSAAELRKYFNVTVFSDGQIPQAEAILIVKKLPTPKQLDQFEKNKTKVIYFPIDYFESEYQITSNSHILNRCDMIVSHSERLIPNFLKYTKTEYIDHNGKYFLKDMAEYKESGYALWVGGFQYVPYLIARIKRHIPLLEIKILADIYNPKALRRAQIVAGSIGLDLQMNAATDSINGIKMYNWTEDLQREMMNECKAAIDIKWSQDFNQNHKPPTKAQKYVCSGIPLAMNTGCESVAYMEKRGLQIPDPSHSRWISKEYWEEVHKLGEKLRVELSSESIGLKIKNYIEKVI